MPIAIFLRDYWQKKPLLVRHAFPDFYSPISGDEIAGLALDDDVVSRLVIENPSNKHWTLQHGPLPEAIFSELPDEHWTLLIQHADSLEPEINALLNAFRFIPNWRLDDIMVSYASDKGGVGPHFDYFDVFLLQGAGERRWRVGQHCDTNTALVPDQPMKILSEFTTQEEWILAPGDLLYIPPQIAHWGEAIGESITYSIGFRAPSHSDILLEYTQDSATQCSEDQRYTDPDLVWQDTAGEISPQSIERFREILLRYCNDNEKIGQWLGEFSTQLKQDVDAGLLPTLTTAQLIHGDRCQLHPFARCAYQRTEKGARCFINGHTWECSLILAETLSSFSPFTYQQYNKADQQVLTLLAEGNLLVAENYYPVLE
jgi:50S ribosomal protein L16 3-hydroxylase